jgi:nicotinamidase-related amidase
VSRVARAQDGYITSLIRARQHTNGGGPLVSDRPTTALLVMDVQNGIVERFGDAVVAPAARAIAAARDAGVPVIFVRVAFRPGHPEVSPRNRTFGRLAEAGGMGLDDEATAIHAALAPEPDDVVVVKRRVSAFTGSDLDVVLRARGIDSLVLCGIATSGVVLSTLRQAADLDFGLTVLRDACADADDEVHRVLLDKVFPRQAEVVDVAAWAASLAPAGAAASR